MKITVHGKPTFRIKFNRTLVKALMAISEAHYDHACRSLSRVGGWVHGLKNSFELCSSDNYQEWLLSWHEADLSMKVMEMRKLHSELSADEHAALDDFRNSLHRAMQVALGTVWSIDVSGGADAPV